jgi:hypothetical protein
MPEETPEGGAGTALAETTTFTQEDVDRIVTERLRRERQRAEKTVRDEYEGRIAELEAAREAGQGAAGELESLKTELQAARKQALIAERLQARRRDALGPPLPPAYVAQINGEDEASIEAAIIAAEAQWEADLRQYARKPVDVGRPVNPVGGGPEVRTPRVDADLAERMKRGDPEAFRQYTAIRGH